MGRQGEQPAVAIYDVLRAGQLTELGGPVCRNFPRYIPRHSGIRSQLPRHDQGNAYAVMGYLSRLSDSTIASLNTSGGRYEAILRKH